MTQPDWRKIEDVPDEDWERGWVFRYSQQDDVQGVATTKAQAQCYAKNGQVYGPIPDPPKPPPAIYRFEADWNGIRVSGIYVPDEHFNPRLCRVFRPDRSGNALLDHLTDIHWRDTPPEGVE